MGHEIYDPGQEDRTAWNVGRKLGAKRLSCPSRYGLYASSWSRSAASVIAPSSILRSTASFVVVTL